MSPGHPHEPGGVTDLTSRLVRHWSEAGLSVQVASDRTEDPEQLAARLSAAGISAVLLQYVPFLYGRRGLSRYPGSFAESASRRGIRVVVFVHEPWVPLTRLQWLVTGPLQRRQLRRLVRRTAGCVTPVPAWQSLLSPAPLIQYVGSTLGPAPSLNGAEPVLTGPVVFSPFGAGLNWGWIAEAVAAIEASPRLIVLGASESEARRHPTVGGWVSSDWDFRGRLSASDALGLMARAPLVLAPFIDGLTGRRTSVAAALSTGARVISSTGPLFDSFFHQSPVKFAGSASGFTQLALEEWRRADAPSQRAERKGWYDRTLDPRVLDHQLLQIVLGT